MISLGNIIFHLRSFKFRGFCAPIFAQWRTHIWEFKDFIFMFFHYACDVAPKISQHYLHLLPLFSRETHNSLRNVTQSRQISSGYRDPIDILTQSRGTLPIILSSKDRQLLLVTTPYDSHPVRPPNHHGLQGLDQPWSSVKSTSSLQDEFNSMIYSWGPRLTIQCPQVTGDISMS